jgi:hypothetical protein
VSAVTQATTVLVTSATQVLVQTSSAPQVISTVTAYQSAPQAVP